MSFLKNLFGAKPGPFMEHPSGDFDSAIDAMEDAVRRLRELRNWNQWITFGAQGEGSRPDSYEFAEVKMLGNQLDAGNKLLDASHIIQTAHTAANSLV